MKAEREDRRPSIDFLEEPPDEYFDLDLLQQVVVLTEPDFLIPPALATSTTATNLREVFTCAALSLTKVITRVLMLLFRAPIGRPNHLLASGYLVRPLFLSYFTFSAVFDFYLPRK